jgi:hypothetical protein
VVFYLWGSFVRLWGSGRDVGDCWYMGAPLAGSEGSPQQLLYGRKQLVEFKRFLKGPLRAATVKTSIGPTVSEAQAALAHVDLPALAALTEG